MESAAQSKTYLVRYLVITFTLSYLYMAFVIYSGGVAKFGLPGLILLMWIPGATSIVYRLVTKIGFGDVGWKRGSAKFYALAIGLPLSIAILTNFISSLFSLREFSIMPSESWGRFSIGVIVSLVAGVIGALGEELGWRGFLVPKIVNTGIRFPLLVTGVIWALWHLPIVVFGGYYKIEAPVLIALTYTLSIIGIGYFIGWLCLTSGSVWIATAAHASHNFFLQLLIPFLFFAKEGTNAKWWEAVGADAGAIPALLYLTCVFVGFQFLKRKVPTPAFRKLSTATIKAGERWT